MAQMIAPVASLLFSVVLLLLGHGLQMTIVPLASLSLQFEGFMIGLAASAYFAGFVAGAIITPHVVVRAGHIRGFAVMVSSMSAAALLHPLVTQAEAWILFRFMTGFCISGLYLIIESWLNEFADNSNRGLIMSVYIVVNYAAFTCGQLMATLAGPESFHLFAIASIIISMAVMPVAMTKAAQPAPIAIVKLDLRKVFKTSPAAIVSALVIGVVVGSHMSFAPIYAVEKGYNSMSQAPIFAAMLGLGGMLSQWPIGRFSDRMDRRLVLLVISILGIFASISITLLDSGNFYLFLFVGALIGAATQPAYSLAAAHGYDHANENGYVRMAAGLLVSFGVGSSIGPVVTSVLMQYMGVDALFLFPCFLLAFLVAYLAVRIVRNDALVAEDKDDFDFASTSATLGGVVSPELLNEEDRYVVVPDSWEPSEEEEEISSDEDTEAAEAADTEAEPEETDEAHDAKDDASDGAPVSSEQKVSAEQSDVTTDDEGADKPKS
ncbi:Predicted arabinose efflux permease, MFS family [Cohaesibacter sp. ES.047]|uniref:MFS transporter n=1 Tax=Cohaesibacter sp. ES.047 TaxID=1798205 RepID=UPI000BC03E17|nr:MFS transporter [Cohaesibacter sp. ES.047]SNY92004.1 Predicted arabinose efflux permease, MFS family [Cohaesibacter sp. ES.047]